VIAKVVLNSNSSVADRLYDYIIPDTLETVIRVGNRVIVPFGKSNKTVEAYVYELANESDYDNLKSVSRLVDEFVYFDSKAVEVAEFMRHRYFCTYVSAIKCFLPSSLNVKFEQYVSPVDSKIEEAHTVFKNSVTAGKILKALETYGTLSLTELKETVAKNNVPSIVRKLEASGFIEVSTKAREQVTDTKKTHVELIIERYEAYALIESIQSKAPARARVLEILCESSDVELSELLEYASTAKATVDALVKRGYVAYREVVYNDTNLIIRDVSEYKRHTLNSRQRHVVDTISCSIENNVKKTFLIHGVTGSGKTEVYLELMEKTIQKGANAIMLVPEISLTPQMIAQIYARFGDNVAVLHSKLTVKQRYNEWKKIKNGDVKIAVGARSAIFAPFKNIGLIIIDEEHETTYKAEMSPKYNTIEIARIISRQHNSVLVLASATPSVDSYFKACNGSFELLEMPERVNNSPLPEVSIVDMREELSNGNMSIFSMELFEKIKLALERKEQIILFLNRRGFSGFVSCRNCGYVMQCPNCNVSLKFHRYSNRMVCHYCDYKTSVKNVCPSCSSKHIRYFGIGTERVVDELNKLFPDASVIRMDADTTSKKYDHEKILTTFRNGDADILVGTQMITKGLDFANVTLVGIVAADMSLNMDDFRAGERTFDLITQVAGRAGRSEKTGLAVIQTYNPDDEIIIQSANQNYKKFYESEINIRRMLMNPPFSEYINFLFVGENKSDAQEHAFAVYEEVKAYFDQFGNVYDLFKPCETSVFKLGGKYRYHFLLKTAYKKDIYDALHVIYDKYKNNSKDVIMLIEVNPVNMY